MGYKNLKSEEMLQLSGSWLGDNPECHTAIRAIPLLAESLNVLAAVHTTLSTLLQPAPDPRLAAIIDDEARIDARLGALIRAVHGFLTVTSEFIGGDEGRSFLKLRDFILPDGLTSQLKSYRAEAGAAAQLEDRLSPEVRATTDALQIGRGPTARTLTTYLDEWIALGKQLGQLENEKGTLLTAKASSGTSRPLLGARNAWGRVVTAMVTNGQLAELDRETETLIFAPLVDAERRADERARTSAVRHKTEANQAAADERTRAKAAADQAAVDEAVRTKLAADKGTAHRASLDTAAAYEATLSSLITYKTAAERAAAYQLATDKAAATARGRAEPPKASPEEPGTGSPPV